MKRFGIVAWELESKYFRMKVDIRVLDTWYLLSYDIVRQVTEGCHLLGVKESSIDTFALYKQFTPILINSTQQWTAHTRPINFIIFPSPDHVNPSLNTLIKNRFTIASEIALELISDFPKGIKTTPG